MSLNVYLHDNHCDKCGRDDEIFWRNITHNLGKMAKEAEIYECLWYPEDLGIEFAEQLIYPLTIGLEKLKSSPEHYKQFNAPNGWGLYDNLVAFVEIYLENCKKYPNAKVKVSR